MMTLHHALQLLAQANLKAELKVVEATHEQARFTGVCIDSRKVQTGDLFVALGGEKVDGHDFVAQVGQQGAAVALVARYVECELPQLVVSDTRIALGALARGWRQQFDLPVIAVTGSNGKTTTKEMIAAILTAAYGAEDRLATIGNLNNDIGLPLTLLRLRSHHRAAVVELGMNHPGETEWLASLAQPTVALINNAQREHQEFMHSVAAVAREHSLVLLALPAHGVAVFPADEDYTPLWREAVGPQRVIDFGIHVQGRDDDATNAAAVTALPYLAADHADVHLQTPVGATTVKLQATGLHNVRNATAATAVAVAIGLPLEIIHRGLEAFTPVKGRMQHLRTPGGLHLIDDTYNANPDSARAAIDVLAQTSAQTTALTQAPTLLILGDMGEVGNDGPAFHAEIGAYARERGISVLLTTGKLMEGAMRAYSSATTGTQDALTGLSAHFDSIDMLIEKLPSLVRAVQPGAVLVKGSRFMRMERVIDALMQAAEFTNNNRPAH